LANGNSKFSLFIQGSSIQSSCLPLTDALNNDIQIDLDIIEIEKVWKYWRPLIQRREVSFSLKLGNQRKDVQNLLMNIAKSFFLIFRKLILLASEDKMIFNINNCDYS